MMIDLSTTIAAQGSRQIARTIQIGLVALLGLVMIGLAGFVEIDRVHNAAHDYRHSMGFPCH
jgi:cobalt transporter subunit CbtB